MVEIPSELAPSKSLYLNHIVFKPKMDLISAVILFRFLEIQSNNVPVDDKPYQAVF